MQAVSFPSPAPPPGASASPQPHPAGKDDGGFGRVLRTLPDQARASGPGSEPADSALTVTLPPDASDADAQAQAQADLMAPDLRLTDAPEPAEQPGADPTGAAGVLSLLVSGAAMAARLPPAAFAITQGSEGAMTVLALAVPQAAGAVTDADAASMPDPGAPQALPDAADDGPAPAQPQGLSRVAGLAPGPGPLAEPVQTGPDLRAATGTPLPAHIALADRGIGASFALQEKGTVPAVFAFRSAQHPDAPGPPDPAADPDGPAAPPFATPDTAGLKPDPVAATTPQAAPPETMVPPFRAGDAENPFGAPSSLVQGAQPSPLQGSGAPFVPTPLAATLSDLLVRQTDGPVEVTLSPEELGRVRLSLSTNGDGLLVTVQVERGDTLDLLRRNSDLLLHEIRAQGFSGATFSFSGWAEDQPDPGAQASPDATGQDVPSDGAVPAPPAFPSAATGLDLRL